jgi:putative oxidoreductase
MTMHSGTTHSTTTHPSLSHTDSIATSWTDTLLFGVIFLTSGFGKLSNIAATTQYFAAQGLTPAGFWAWFGGLYEFLIGAALIVGIGTRYAAVATFIWVIAATLIAHRYWSYPEAQQRPQQINFMKNLAIMGGALYIFVLGAGRYAVDAMLAKRDS